MKEDYEYLYRLLANCRIKLRKWIDSGESTIIPGITLYDAFEELAGAIGTGITEIGEEHSANEFRTEWEGFKRRLLATQDPTEIPGTPFWRCWFAMETELTRSEQLPPLIVETMDDLLKNSGNGPVKPHQIAKIYGWYMRDGSPDVAKVAEEIRKPGTHLTPDYQTPMQKQRSEKNRRLEEDQRFWQGRLERKINVMTEVAHESLESLLLAGVSVNQISRMKRMHPDQIKSECARLGIPCPPDDYGIQMLQPGAFDPAKTEEKERLKDIRLRQVGRPDKHNHPALSTVQLSDDGDSDVPAEEPADDIEPQTVEEVNEIEQVIGYAAAGMDPNQIGQLVGLGVRKVKKILKEHGGQPAN